MGESTDDIASDRRVQPLCRVRLVRTGRHTLDVHIAGELDELAVSRIRTIVDIDTEAVVVVDLSEVRFMSSAAVNWLVALHRGCGQLLVRAPSAPARRILEVTGLDGVFAVVGEEEGTTAPFPSVLRG
jgi:anti-anti-sigma factor